MPGDSRVPGYSERNTSAGADRAARVAGAIAATMAAPSKIAVEAAKVPESVGLT